MKVEMMLNGAQVAADVEPRLLLVEAIRQLAGATGTKVGCDTSECGACTVLLDGDPVKSCTVLAVQVDGRTVTTVEGLTPETGLSPVQAAFHEEHGLQCGYCTPGLVVATTALLVRHPDPDDELIADAIAGNICRCTGYVNILRAVRMAAALLRGEHPEPEAGRSHQSPLVRREVARRGVNEDIGGVEVI